MSKPRPEDLVYVVIIRNSANNAEYVDSVMRTIKQAKKRIAELVEQTDFQYVMHIEEHKVE